MNRISLDSPIAAIVLAATLVWGAVMAGMVVAAEPPAPASFAYILQADKFASDPPTAVEQLAKSDRDWIVLDARFSAEAAWRPADLQAIRAGRPGRKVIAYLSIGEAESYRPYFKKEWLDETGWTTDAAPEWLGDENPDWEGNYRVKYWRPAWQKLMLEMVDEAMSSGFDGLYLDIVDGFEQHEYDGLDFIDYRPNPDTGQSYRRDMIEWVTKIAIRARAKNPEALIIPQNGSQLLAHDDFLFTISAIGIEDLFTDGLAAQPQSHWRYVLSFLERMKEKNKPVLLIEYPKTDIRRRRAMRMAKTNNLVWLMTDRDLTTLGESGK